MKDSTKSYRVYQKQEGLLPRQSRAFSIGATDVWRLSTGIDLQVEQGEFVAFLGPNGAARPLR